MQDTILLSGTIGSGGTISGELTSVYNTAEKLGMRDIIGIKMPAAFTGTSIGMVASYDGTAFGVLTDTAGSAVNIKAAASSAIPITNTLYSGIQSVKVFSGSAQGQDTIINVIARRP